MVRVVIVDDDRNVLRGMKRVIPWRELQAECIGECIDGKQGLDLIRQTQPDIVITDIYMPVMNGLEMIQQLRSEAYLGKIVILSGYNDFEYARQALRLQVDDYLSKPATIQTMTDVLNRCISKLIPPPEQEAEQTVTQRVVRPTRYYHQLAQSIRHPREEQTQQILRECFHEISQRATELTSTQIHQIGEELWTILTSALYDVGIDLAEIFLNLDLRVEMGLELSLQQLEDWFAEKVTVICEYRLHGNLKHKKAVEYIVHYINEHFSEDLTLNDLANQVFLSRNYLSQIFRKTTGESFNNYLTRVRIEKAKEFILEGKYLIYEVAEMVGYKNTPYFSTLFKKYTGLNPTELL